MKYLLLLCLLISACKPHPHNYQGYVEGENIYLATPYSGTLIKMMARRGQHVRKGDLLFELDPNPQHFISVESKYNLLQGEETLLDLIAPRRRAEIAAIMAQIQQAVAQINLAALRVQRNQTLYDKHVVDRDTLDQAIEHHKEVLELKVQYEENLALAKEGARINQIEAERAVVGALGSKHDAALWDELQKKVYAPVDGVIFDTYFKEGEFVSAQKPIASLLAPQNIRLDFFVPEDIVNQLSLGQHIKFTAQGCASIFTAVINYISPEVEYEPPLVYSRENNHQLVFRIKAVAQDPGSVKPGQSVLIDLAG